MTSVLKTDRYLPIIDGYDAFLEACERPLPSTALVNTVKADPEWVFDAYDDAGIDVEKIEWCSGGLRFLDDIKVGNTLPHYAGWIHAKEEVSMLPADVLGVSPEDTVLDVCAAPGSKTVALAQKAGTVVANDINIGRLSALRNNTDRLGLTNVAVTSYDGRNYPRGQSYDAVVVDAPCSAEGTVRKNPDADITDETDRASLIGVQKGLLGRALSLVSEGGIVVYSTCTFAPEENEGVLESVINNGAEVLDVELSLDTSPGLTEWQDKTYPDEVQKAHRIYPHLNDTGGFFIATLRSCTS